MKSSFSLVCPVCGAAHFLLKHEASYVYSYCIDAEINPADADAPGLQNKTEFLPFLFDDREQQYDKQYVECRNCGERFPCYFDHWDSRIGLQALQNALRAKDPRQNG
jgi:hypothetical protein